MFSREYKKAQKTLSEAYRTLVDSVSIKPKPIKITEEKFWEMLEILPPCRWHDVEGWNVFHMSQRLTDNLVSWYARREFLNEKEYFTFINDSRITDEKIVEILGSAK